MIPILPYEIPAPLALPYLGKIISAFLRHKRLAIVLSSLVIGGGIASCHLINRVTELDPVFYGPEFQSVNALALYELGAYSQAAERYRTDYVRYLEDQTNTPPYLVSILRRDPAGATQWAEQELQRNPDSIDALLTLAQVSYDVGEFSRASKYVRQVLALYWDNTDALLLAALIATRDPSQGDAIDYLNTALRTGTAARNLMSFINVLEITGYIQRQKLSERSYALLAHYFRVLRIYDTGMTNRVIRTARRAIRKGDHPAEALFSIGLMFEKMGEPHKALEAYNQAINISPRQAMAYYRVSRLYSRTGDFLHEYLLLKGAFKAAPGDRLLISALSQHLLEKREWYAVVQLMKEVLEVDPENLTAHIYLAWALHSLGERNQATEVYRRIMALEARGPLELEHKSRTANGLGDRRQQEALLHRSIQLDRERPFAHRELAQLYKQEGRNTEALEEFETVLRMGGYDRPDEWQEYCELYQKSGDANRAQACAQMNGTMAQRHPLM